MTMGAAVWVASNALDYILFSIFLTRLTYAGAVLIAVGFFYFSLYFPFQKFSISKMHHFLIILLPAILIVILFTATNIFIRDINWDTLQITYGSVFHIFNIVFLIYWFWGIYNFVKKYRTADGIHRWQLKNIFWAIIFSLIAGITTNLILPWVFGIWTLGWIGPMFSIFFLGFASYILFKRNI